MAIFVRNHRVAVAKCVLLLVAMDQQLCAEAAARAVTGAHHVVGGDPGWDVASNIPSWPANRLFMVGDNLWFAYSVLDGGVAEVGGKAQFEACEVGNPIRMYTEGLNRIDLDEEGSRYFVSADPFKCKNGLKLHVKVRPPVYDPSLEAKVNDGAAAPGPVPSGSSGLQGVASLMWILLSLVYAFRPLGI